MEAAGGKLGESGDSQGVRPVLACAFMGKLLPDAVTGGSRAGGGPVHYLGKDAYCYYCHFWFTKQMCCVFSISCCITNPPDLVKDKDTCHLHNFRSVIWGSVSWVGPAQGLSRGCSWRLDRGRSARPCGSGSVLAGGWGFGSSHAAPALAVVCPRGPAACLLKPVTREGEGGRPTPPGPFSAGRDSSGRGYWEGRVLRGCGV